MCASLSLSHYLVSLPCFTTLEHYIALPWSTTLFHYLVSLPCFTTLFHYLVSLPCITTLFHYLVPIRKQNKTISVVLNKKRCKTQIYFFGNEKKVLPLLLFSDIIHIYIYIYIGIFFNGINFVVQLVYTFAHLKRRLLYSLKK